MMYNVQSVEMDNKTRRGERSVDRGEGEGPCLALQK